MGISVRDATREDASAIASIWNPVIRDSEATFNSIEVSERDVQDMIDRKRIADRPFIVACRPEVVAFGTYRQFRSGIGYKRSMEHTLIVDERMRGEGVGLQIVEHLEAFARCRGVHSMIAGITGANLAGIEFHRSIGFLEIARLPEVGYKFDRYYDLVLMQKIL